MCFLDRVLARWPTNAKNPKSALRNKLRWNAAELGVVFLDLQRKVLAPLSVALRGVRFRHVISDEDAQSGVLLIDVGHTVFMPGYHWQAIAALPSLQLLDAAGQVLRTHVVSRALKLPALLGDRPLEVPGLDLAAWFRYHHVHAGDSLLVTVDEFDPPRWRIEHEPVARRDEEAIQRRNAELANILFVMLESAQDEEIRLRESVRSAHLQLRDPGGYPGDPWLDAIEADGRMRMDDMYIRYREDRRGLWGGLLFDLASEQDNDLGKRAPRPASQPHWPTPTPVVSTRSR